MPNLSSWKKEELVSLLDHELISQRYFFPQRAVLPGACAVETQVGRLACWRSAPPSNRPVLLHFHGNGELVHDWIPEFAPWVVSQGFDVFLAEYRGYGASAGTPCLGGMLEDLDCIVEATGVTPERILCFGRSIGSLYAVEVVTRFPETMGLVLESGVSDLMERILLRVTPEELNVSIEMLQAALKANFDQEGKLSSYTNPCLFLHAENDQLVDISHAERNYAACGSKDKELIRFERGDHNTIFFENKVEYYHKLNELMQRIRP